MLPMEFAQKGAEDQHNPEPSDAPLASGTEKPSSAFEETDWRQRKATRRKSTEEEFVAERRASAARMDREAGFG
jgi:hypothetical protein